VVGVRLVVVAAKPRIRRRQAADVEQLRAHFDGTIHRRNVVQDDLHLALAAAQGEPATGAGSLDRCAASSRRAADGVWQRNLDELAAEHDILQMEVARKPPNGIDGGEVAPGALGRCRRDREGRERRENHENPISCS
jgi:hypothetical protein